MNLNEYIDDIRPTLAGYYLLRKLFPKYPAICMPYPTAELSEDDLDNLKNYLYECMPLDSMIIDLWDWDCHFESDLEDDWYFETAFGPNSRIKYMAEQLADYFFEKVEEYAMDFDRSGDNYEFFEIQVKEESQRFILDWRDNILKRIAKQRDTHGHNDKGQEQ